MKYLSIDMEATGLGKDDLIIEFAMIPFDVEAQVLAHDLTFYRLIQCPPFSVLRPRLDKWVVDHNRSLIEKAHREGILMDELKKEMETYLKSRPVREYFKLKDDDKIVLFGKSLSAIDLPFLNRDLGEEFMRRYFHHHTLDLTSVVYALTDLNYLPEETRSGSSLSEHYHMGDVAHTALEDACNMATIYMKIKNQFLKEA